MDPSEKLIYLYLITGPMSNMEGLYKLSLKRASFETGFDREMFLQLCARAESNRVAGYREGWACVVQATRYMPKSPQMKAHAQGLYATVPTDIHNWATSLGYEYATDFDLDEEDRTYRFVGAGKRRRVMDRHNNRCALCGSHDELIIHHVTRLADGGTNADDNLVPLCQKCHIEVHRKDWTSEEEIRRYRIALDNTIQNNTKPNDDTVFHEIRKVVGLAPSGGAAD